MELCFSATPRAGATPPGAQVPRVWRGGWRDRDRVDRIAHNTTSKSKERAAVARGVWCGLWCECEWKGAMEQRETTSNGGAGDRDRDRRGLGPRPSDSDSASRQHFMYSESLERTAHRSTTLPRTLPIGPGGLQSGFSALGYRICTMYEGTSAKKGGPADSPPPRWPPGPGFRNVARGRAA
jgi:hypothetical protein